MLNIFTPEIAGIFIAVCLIGVVMFIKSIL
jgi:hypothetical protein